MHELRFKNNAIINYNNKLDPVSKLSSVKGKTTSNSAKSLRKIICLCNLTKINIISKILAV